MNWRRGLMRTYLVLWFLWAATLTWTCIFGSLRYDPPTKRTVVQVPGDETSYPHSAADPDSTIYYDWREVPRSHTCRANPASR